MNSKLEAHIDEIFRDVPKSDERIILIIERIKTKADTKYQEILKNGFSENVAFNEVDDWLLKAKIIVEKEITKSDKFNKIISDDFVNGIDFENIKIADAPIKPLKTEKPKTMPPVSDLKVAEAPINNKPIDYQKTMKSLEDILGEDKKGKIKKKAKKKIKVIKQNVKSIKKDTEKIKSDINEIKANKNTAKNHANKNKIALKLKQKNNKRHEPKVKHEKINYVLPKVEKLSEYRDKVLTKKENLTGTICLFLGIIIALLINLGLANII